MEYAKAIIFCAILAVCIPSKGSVELTDFKQQLAAATTSNNATALFEILGQARHSSNPKFSNLATSIEDEINKSCPPFLRLIPLLFSIIAAIGFLGISCCYKCSLPIEDLRRQMEALRIMYCPLIVTPLLFWSSMYLVPSYNQCALDHLNAHSDEQKDIQ